MLNVVSVSNFPSAIPSVYKTNPDSIHSFSGAEQGVVSGTLLMPCDTPGGNTALMAVRSDSSSYPQFSHDVAQTCTVEAKGQLWYDCHLLKNKSYSFLYVRKSIQCESIFAWKVYFNYIWARYAVPVCRGDLLFTALEFHRCLLNLRTLFATSATGTKSRKCNCLSSLMVSMRTTPAV